MRRGGEQRSQIRQRRRRTLCGRGRQGIQRQHFFDGADTGDGIFSTRKGQRHRANELALHIHRASAHTLHHARMFQRPAGKPRQNNGLAGADVFEDAQNLRLKSFHRAAGKYGTACGLHAGPDVFQRHNVQRGACRGNQRQECESAQKHAKHSFSVIGAAEAGGS